MSEKLPPNLMIEDNGDKPMQRVEQRARLRQDMEKAPLWPLFHA